MVRPPPLKSKHAVGPTQLQLNHQRRLERNEKARLRMAERRAELRAKSFQEQERAAERSRSYQATYRERNRNDLKIWERLRRIELYRKRYGDELTEAYIEEMRRRKRARHARKLKRAKADAAAAAAAEAEASDADGSVALVPDGC